MILQDSTTIDEPTSALHVIGDQFAWVLLAYLAFFLLRFFRPLLAYTAPGDFQEDVERLKNLVRQDFEQRSTGTADEERLADLDREVQEVQQELNAARMEATVAQAAADLDALARLHNGEIPALEHRLRTLQDQNRTLRLSVRRSSTDQLENLQSLRASYSHPLVQQAVGQVRAQFPQSHYQRFDLSLLPSFGAYSEALATARNMAGVFVLLGLLGTMIKLNGVVNNIRTLTATTRLESSDFLTQMSLLMQGIGGAFSNSIYGVILMVGALVVMSAINVGVQRRITALDLVISQEVVPTLAEIHNRHLPEFTLSDILRTTGDQLDALNQTVNGLTEGMSSALSGLGGKIGEMLQQFGSYQKQYKLLNDWVGTLEEASAEMKATAGALNQAALRVGQPIDQMNQVLQEHLQAQAQYQSSGFIEHLLQEIKSSLDASRRDQDELAARSLRVSEEALLRAASASEALATGAQSHAGQVENELREVAAALRATSGTQIGQAVTRLNATTEQIADRLDHSATAFERASRNLNAYARAPTFFFWLTQVAFPAVARMFRRGRRQAPLPPRRTRSSPPAERKSYLPDPSPGNLEAEEQKRHTA